MPKRKTDTSVHLKKRAFLSAYVKTGTVAGAASAARIGRTSHYEWLEKDKEYASSFAEAKEEATDNLEQEARRRAVDGVLEPVFWQGELVGRVRKYSDTLLIFLLKGAHPGKYRENVRLTGDEQHPLTFRFIDPRGNIDSQAKPRP